MRAFHTYSDFTEGSLALALAPALTPKGLDTSPLFFKGRVLQPLVIARSLLTLADIASTRYFKPAPVTTRDPILTAQGDRLRAECFSACNGVYARLDLQESVLDGEISYGTSNVDIGLELRQALMAVKSGDKLRLAIGEDGLNFFHNAKKGEELSNKSKFVRERAVEMPDRWIRALGNCVEIHKGMNKVFSLSGLAAKTFISTLPPVTGKDVSGYLSYSRSGVSLSQRQAKDSVYISGLHRLGALKRISSNVRALTFYAPKDGEKGPLMLSAELNGARMTLSLTAAAHQGYSGEGALLETLSKSDIIEYADSIASLLEFQPKIIPSQIASTLGLPSSDAELALALLASSGKLGYDAEEGAYFHRELPFDEDRVLKDNPRLIGARKLQDRIKALDEKTFIVHSGDVDYRVVFDRTKNIGEAMCSCSWYMKHKNSRGPCKHILAVKLSKEVASREETNESKTGTGAKHL